MAQDLVDDLEQQAHVVQSYGQWPEDTFRKAATAWLHLADALAAQDNGRLGEEANANVVRAVHLKDGTNAVLKVSVTDSPHEGAMLRHYNTELGLAVPLIAEGITPDGYPWVLTERLDGHEPVEPLADSTLASAATTARRARLANGTLQRQTGRHWESASYELLRQMSAVHAGVRDLIVNMTNQDADTLLARLRLDIVSGPHALTHGDWRSRNSLVTPNNSLVLLDPVGRTGPPETDMSTWIAIACAKAAANPTSAISVAAKADCDIDLNRLRTWTAFRMLLLIEQEPRTGFLQRDPQELADALAPLLSALAVPS